MDKMTIQVAIVLATYGISYFMMFGLGEIASGLKSIIYGFNFLFGVLAAALAKVFIKMLRKTKIMHKQYTNDFLMNRLSAFFFDLMIVAGIGAIRLDLLRDTWWVVLLLGVVGAISTYFYNRYVARKLFPLYSEEQFLVMYGMLTGTASTGVMLLREADPAYETPAADNLVYQNLPAIIFGFPLMFLATMAPEQPYLVLLILFLFFVVMNVILFRSFIFKRKKTKSEKSE
jgi:ESS family glutamate:Na+ symporter